MRFTAERNIKLCQLQEAGVLTLVVDMLDDDTTNTVISRFECFRRSVSLKVVERALRQVFGERWMSYYDVYSNYSSGVLDIQSHGANTGFSSASGHVREGHAVDSRQVPNLWGLGYRLPLPCCRECVNGLAVQVVMNTVVSIANNCSKHEFSFIPGEPSEYDIRGIWSCENGRLLWIEYSLQSNRNDWIYCDVMNTSGSFIDGNLTYLGLDGQNVVEGRFRGDNCISMARNQSKTPKIASGHGHEVWDLAGSPRPRCLWSSFQRTESSLTTKRYSIDGHKTSSTQEFGVRRFALDYYNDFMHPMRPFRRTWIKLSSSDWQRFPCEKNEFHRFVTLENLYYVVDILHLDLIKFQDSAELLRPRLSYDGIYLGAISRDMCCLPINLQEDSGCTLAVWRVELPRPVLVWPQGIRGLCQRCEWIVDKDWLIIHCGLSHQTRAYSLKNAGLEPEPIDVTRFVGKIVSNRPLFRVCGLNDNIVFYDDTPRSTFGFVRLEPKAGSRGWTATPLRLSTQSANFTKEEAESAGLNTTRYIRSVGKRYVLTTTGALFDLSKTGTSNEQANGGKATLEPAPYAKGFQVMALFSQGQNTIAVVHPCQDDMSTIRFWLLIPQGNKQLVHASTYPRIKWTSVQLITFGQDGNTAFITPRSHDAYCGGWIVVFTKKLQDMALEATRSDYRILNVPKLTWRRNPEEDSAEEIWVKIPVFGAKGTVMMHEVRGKPNDFGNLHAHSRTYVNDLIRFDAHSAQIDSEPLGRSIENETTEPLDEKQAEALSNGVSMAKRLKKRYKRWIDVLMEEPRDREYCNSITETGEYVTLLPGRRFLAYIAHEVPEINAVQHVELCDLRRPLPNRHRLRRSLNSFMYYVELRRECCQSRT